MKARMARMRKRHLTMPPAAGVLPSRGCPEITKAEIVEFMNIWKPFGMLHDPEMNLQWLVKNEIRDLFLFPDDYIQPVFGTVS